MIPFGSLKPNTTLLSRDKLQFLEGNEKSKVSWHCNWKRRALLNDFEFRSNSKRNNRKTLTSCETSNRILWQSPNG